MARPTLSDSGNVGTASDSATDTLRSPRFRRLLSVLRGTAAKEQLSSALWLPVSSSSSSTERRLRVRPDDWGRLVRAGYTFDDLLYGFFARVPRVRVVASEHGSDQHGFERSDDTADLHWHSFVLCQHGVDTRRFARIANLNNSIDVCVDRSRATDRRVRTFLQSAMWRGFWRWFTDAAPSHRPNVSVHWHSDLVPQICGCNDAAVQLNRLDIRMCPSVGPEAARRIPDIARCLRCHESSSVEDGRGFVEGFVEGLSSNKSRLEQLELHQAGPNVARICRSLSRSDTLVWLVVGIYNNDGDDDDDDDDTTNDDLYASRVQDLTEAIVTGGTKLQYLSLRGQCRSFRQWKQVLLRLLSMTNLISLGFHMTFPRTPVCREKCRITYDELRPFFHCNTSMLHSSFVGAHEDTEELFQRLTQRNRDRGRIRNIIVQSLDGEGNRNKRPKISVSVLAPLMSNGCLGRSPSRLFDFIRTHGNVVADTWRHKRPMDRPA